MIRRGFRIVGEHCDKKAFRIVGRHYVIRIVSVLYESTVIGRGFVM